MSTSFLKGNRKRYRSLLDKELAKGGRLLDEDIEQGEIRSHLKNVENCIKKPNDFVEKLEDTDETLSTVIEGRDGAQEIERLISADWEYISTVMDCGDELADLQASLQEQGSPRENSSSASVTEDRFDQMVQLTTQMHKVIIAQQQLLQQISMAQSNTRQYSSIRLPKFEMPSFNGDKLK